MALFAVSSQVEEVSRFVKNPNIAKVQSETCVAAYELGLWKVDKCGFPLVKNANKQTLIDADFRFCMERALVLGQKTVGIGRGIPLSDKCQAKRRSSGDSGVDNNEDASDGNPDGKKKLKRLQPYGDGQCFLEVDEAFTLLGPGDDTKLNDTHAFEVYKLVERPFKLVKFFDGSNRNDLNELIEQGLVSYIPQVTTPGVIPWTSRLVGCAQAAQDMNAEFFALRGEEGCIYFNEDTYNIQEAVGNALASQAQNFLDYSFNCTGNEHFVNEITKELYYPIMQFVSPANGDARLLSPGEQCAVDVDCMFGRCRTPENRAKSDSDESCFDTYCTCTTNTSITVITWFTVFLVLPTLVTLLVGCISWIHRIQNARNATRNLEKARSQAMEQARKASAAQYLQHQLRDPEIDGFGTARSLSVNAARASIRNAAVATGQLPFPKGDAPLFVTFAPMGKRDSRECETMINTIILQVSRAEKLVLDAIQEEHRCNAVHRVTIASVKRENSLRIVLRRMTIVCCINFINLRRRMEELLPHSYFVNQGASNDDWQTQLQNTILKHEPLLWVLYYASGLLSTAIEDPNPLSTTAVSSLLVANEILCQILGDTLILDMFPHQEFKFLKHYGQKVNESDSPKKKSVRRFGSGIANGGEPAQQRRASNRIGRDDQSLLNSDPNLLLYPHIEPSDDALKVNVGAALVLSNARQLASEAHCLKFDTVTGTALCKRGTFKEVMVDHGQEFIHGDSLVHKMTEALRNDVNNFVTTCLNEQVSSNVPDPQSIREQMSTMIPPLPSTIQASDHPSPTSTGVINLSSGILRMEQFLLHSVDQQLGKEQSALLEASDVEPPKFPRAYTVIQQALSMCGDARYPSANAGNRSVQMDKTAKAGWFGGYHNSVVKNFWEWATWKNLLKVLLMDAVPIAILLGFLVKINRGSSVMDVDIEASRVARAVAWGTTFTAVPAYYDIDSVSNEPQLFGNVTDDRISVASAVQAQKAIVPIIYGLMHIALYYFSILPFTMCHEILQVLGAKFCTGADGAKALVPLLAMRRYHETIGTRMIVCVLLGAGLFLGVMWPSMLAGVRNAGFAFQQAEGTDFFKELLSNKTLIRMIILAGIPTLFLMKFEYRVPAFAMMILPHQIINRWFEFVYGLHLVVSLVLIVLLGLSQPQVFYWPLSTWSLYLANKFLRSWTTAHAITDSIRLTVTSADASFQASSVRIKLQTPSWYSAQPGQIVWVTVPSIDLVSHPFALARTPAVSTSTMEEAELVGQFWGKLPQVQSPKDVNGALNVGMFFGSENEGAIAAKIGSLLGNSHDLDNTIELAIAVQKPPQVTGCCCSRRRLNDSALKLNDPILENEEQVDGDDDGSDDEQSNSCCCSMSCIRRPHTRSVAQSMEQDILGIDSNKKARQLRKQLELEHRTGTWTQRLARQLAAADKANSTHQMHCKVSLAMGSSLTACLSAKFDGSVIIGRGHGVVASESILRQVLAPRIERPRLFFYVVYSESPEEILGMVESIRDLVCTAVMRNLVSIEGLSETSSQMMGWLGLTLFVSNATNSSIQPVREQISEVIRKWDNPYNCPLQVEERIRNWILNRIVPGECTPKSTVIRALEVISARTDSNHLSVGYRGPEEFGIKVKDAVEALQANIYLSEEYC